MKKLLLAAGVAMSFFGLTSASSQPAWPSQPVRIVVPFAAGSLTDTAARALARELSVQLDEQFVVENRGGAGGIIGTDIVAKSKPDGYTLVFTDSSYMISAALYKNLSYKPLTDLTPVMLVVEAPAVFVVRKDLPAKTLQDVVALAKKEPGEITFGTGGQGSSAHLATELFASQVGVEMRHVPYKGVAAALVDVMANRVDLTIPSMGAAISGIRSGMLRPLAVTGQERVPLLPDVPTFAQAGYPSFDVAFRFGFLAPAGTPQAVIDRLSEQLVIASRKPAVMEFLATQGARPIQIDHAQYADIIKKEIGMWKGVIDTAGISVE
ncbi:MAG: tripartite tricarboxylate transporter substrate binding protein [Candidimonas sp.]